MMRGGFAFSIGLHTLILLIALLGLPFLKPRPLQIPPSISVDVLDVGKEATTNQISPANKVEKQIADSAQPPKPQPTPTPKPAPRPQLDADLPAVQATDSAQQPLAVPEIGLKKQFAPVLPEVAAAGTADTLTPPKVELKKKQPKPPTEDMSAVLKNLEKLKPAPTETEPQTQPKPVAHAATGAQAPLSDKLTASETDALRHQLEQCWNMPAGVKDAQNLVVDLAVEMNPDRTVRSVVVVDQARFASDPVFRAAAMSAERALRMPQCTPLALPPDKYDEWQSMTLTFDPKDMLG
jgi:hypothetical protein